MRLLRDIFLLCCFVLVAAVLPAQELLFPMDKSQLEFTSTFSIHEPMRVQGPGDFVRGVPTFSGIIGMHHRIHLPMQFGVAFGGELGIVPYNWSYQENFIPIGDDQEAFRARAGAEYYSGFQMSIPVSLSKRISLSTKSRLRIGLDGLLHFYPFTINNAGVGYGASLGTDSSTIELMRGEVRPTPTPFALAVRGAVGYERVTSRQNTVGLELLLHLSNHTLHRGEVFELNQNGLSDRYDLSHSINYIGLRFRYGFTYKPDQSGEQIIGAPEVVDAFEQNKSELPRNKYWLSFSTGFQDVQERVEDPNGLYAPTFYSSGTFGISIESHDSLNWRAGFDYLPLWINDGYSDTVYNSTFAFGGYPTLDLHFELGKDVVATPKRQFAMKAWAGLGSYVYLEFFGLNEDRLMGTYSRFGMTNGDTVISDSARIFASNFVVPYARVGLEFDVRLLRRLQLAVVPNYSFGFARMFQSEIQYFTPETGWAEALIFSRGSGFALRFQLKVPIDAIIAPSRRGDKTNEG